MLDYYYMNVSCDCSGEQSLALYEKLSKDRKEKVDRLKRQELADKQILIGAFLEHCLCDYLEISDNTIEFGYNDRGKPYIKGSKLHFNMSHSGDYVVLAVSDHPVGIDIERLRCGRLSVAKRCFCKEEYEDIINAGSEENQNRRFLEYWTLKEAYVKYLGEGLLVPLDSFRIVDVGSASVGILVKNDVLQIQKPDIWYKDDKVYIRSFDFEYNYHVAICGMKTAISEAGECLSDDHFVKKVCLYDIL